MVLFLADDSKLVKSLGPGHPLPVEIVSWDYKHTLQNLEKLPSLLGCRAILRRGSISTEVPDGFYPAITDNDHLIADLYFNDEIEDVGAAASDLDALAGVVAHGLFQGHATTLLIGSEDQNKPVRVVGHYPIDPDSAELPWWGSMPLGRPRHRETVDNREPDLDVCPLPREDGELEAMHTEPMGVHAYGGYREFK
jgi:ribose 5-phosphate isomerase A